MVLLAPCNGGHRLQTALSFYVHESFMSECTILHVRLPCAIVDTLQHGSVIIFIWVRNITDVSVIT